jgi:SPP1 family predicted phage head-tail adaptor
MESLMRAGKLRHLIMIQKLTEPEPLSDIGEIEPDWQDFVSRYASINPLVGREYWSARQVNAEITGKINIRYVSGITPKMRVKFGDRIFNIEAIINVEERNRELVLLVSEKP